MGPSPGTAEELLPPQPGAERGSSAARSAAARGAKSFGAGTVKDYK